jgi:Mycothiol maleylpyruvate isomerase N-terminal domain
MIHEAFGAEAQQLSLVLAGLDDAAFARPSACAPWTVAELAYHVRMTMGRLPGMLAAPEPAGPDLVSAAGYYRADQRFSTATNAGRIQSAQRGAATLAGAAARARDFEVAWGQAEMALRDAPPGRVVRTRHGDRMLLTEFLRTRVLELAVHGLDLVAALDREPWVTVQAADVCDDLLLPPAAAGRLRAETGWDRVGLIARLTGRHLATPSETSSRRPAADGSPWGEPRAVPAGSPSTRACSRA